MRQPVGLRVLALDTATEACSAAVLTDAGVFGVCVEVGRGHADEILRMVDAMLIAAGVGLRDLDGIAASIGPGSFTGVRISVSVAQGLAFGAGLPVVGITTLEALALQVLSGDDVNARALACLDARMGEVYWGTFKADAVRGVGACSALAVSASVAIVGAPPPTPLLGIGRGFAAYPQLCALPDLVIDAAHCAALPDARDLAYLGALRLRAGEGRDAAHLAPVYLRDKVALTELERAALAAARG